MSQQDQTVVVGPMAHTKMLLHACQNPYTQVHGALLGSFGTRSSGGGGPELTITDAIPVFHSSPTKPLLDMALQLIEAHTNSNSGGGGGVGVVGWYSANERLGDDDRPGQAALRIVGGIAAGLEGMGGKAPPTHAEPVAVLVSNRGAVDVLGGDSNGVADLKIFGRDRVNRQQWIKMYAQEHIKCSASSQKVVREVCSDDGELSAPPSIYDFEDHLDGGAENLATRDWLTNLVVTNLVRKSA